MPPQLHKFTRVLKTQVWPPCLWCLAVVIQADLFTALTNLPCACLPLFHAMKGMARYVVTFVKAMVAR